MLHNQPFNCNNNALMYGIIFTSNFHKNVQNACNDIYDTLNGNRKLLPFKVSYCENGLIQLQQYIKMQK